MGAVCHWCAGRDHLGVECAARGAYRRPMFEPPTIEKVVEGAMAAARKVAFAEVAAEAERRAAANGPPYGPMDRAYTLALEEMAAWARGRT